MMITSLRVTSVEAGAYGWVGAGGGGVRSVLQTDHEQTRSNRVCCFYFLLHPYHLNDFICLLRQFW